MVSEIHQEEQERRNEEPVLEQTELASVNDLEQAVANQLQAAAAAAPHDTVSETPRDQQPEGTSPLAASTQMRELPDGVGADYIRPGAYDAPLRSEQEIRQLDTSTSQQQPAASNSATSNSSQQQPATTSQVTSISSAQTDRQFEAAPSRASDRTMISTADAISPEVWVPEFGLFDMVYLEPDRKYQGRIYRLSQEQIRSLSETLGFTARFDHPNIRLAYVDVIKTEGHIVFEIDRNTRPAELNLRYSRDRWSASDASGKSSDALRPWIKSLYDCRFLPEKVGQVVASHVKLDPEKAVHFYIRINFKDKTAGLIAEDKFIETFPAQPFQVFALPEGHVAAIPSVELNASESNKSRQPEKVIVQEVGPKYATYSRSEVDRMMKVQTETITNTLAGKISGQQRSFLEAVEAQEKAFAKITERYSIQFEEARMKLEAHTKSAQEAAQAELAKLSGDLSKELSEFRAHVNKNILPVSKVIEKKVEEIQVAAAKPVEQESLKPILIACSAAILIAIGASTAFIATSVGELQDIKSKVTQLLDKSPH